MSLFYSIFYVYIETDTQEICKGGEEGEILESGKGCFRKAHYYVRERKRRESGFGKRVKIRLLELQFNYRSFDGNHWAFVPKHFWGDFLSSFFSSN